MQYDGDVDGYSLPINDRKFKKFKQWKEAGEYGGNGAEATYGPYPRSHGDTKVTPRVEMMIHDTIISEDILHLWRNGPFGRREERRREERRVREVSGRLTQT